MTGIVGTPPTQWLIHAKILSNRLSDNPFEWPFAPNDALKRAFDDVDCLRGGGSVRELKRPIGSVSYALTALSNDQAALDKHMK